MIFAENGFFLLQTAHTAYCFQLNNGLPEHLYYGEKLPRREDYSHLCRAWRHLPGNSAACGEKLSLENRLWEVSGEGRGDPREPMVKVELPDGSRTCRFDYVSHEITERCVPQGLPAAAGGAETLRLVLRDKHRGVTLEVYYTAFEDVDVITRWIRLRNDASGDIHVLRLASNQLDCDGGAQKLISFRGAWAREMEWTEQSCNGTSFGGSRVGVSSNRCNPFAMLCSADADEESGECRGFHLLYSGDHFFCTDRNAYGQTRFLQGMGELRWRLAPGEALDAPETAMTWSSEGFGGVSRQMHAFIRRHIVRGPWRDRERPVLLNSWEAFYFHADRKKLLALAGEAKKVGIELFVLDDGWFGKREDDTTSLGDWTPNRKKLPDGLTGLVREINALGMEAGVWVEPEMVSEDSELFRAHPDWILGHREQAMGRNQYVLDLSRREVCDYLVSAMEPVFASGVSYVKWDMNRILTDTYSSAWGPEQQGEVAHRYVLGLYDILRRLTEKFPQVLIEGCASGGNRADCGMLCYMPQFWASDNTDALCRSRIQWGYSYGYPQSVLGNHVSDCPNHQTLRTTPLRTRFDVASVGLLGYELSLLELSEEEKRAIKRQIAAYKEARALYQFGTLYRCDADENGCFTCVVSPDRLSAAGVYFVRENRANTAPTVLHAKGLCDEMLYQMSEEPGQARLKDFGGLVNLISPVRLKKSSPLTAAANKLVRLQEETEEITASGRFFTGPGFSLRQNFCSTGYDRKTHVGKDFDTRTFHWTAKTAKNSGKC
jgi:alpha-galactosidase